MQDCSTNNLLCDCCCDVSTESGELTRTLSLYSPHIIAGWTFTYLDTRRLADSPRRA